MDKKEATKWIKDTTEYSLTELTRKGGITNAVDGETSGVFICNKTYLENTGKAMMKGLGMVVPDVKFKYMKFFVSDGLLDTESPYAFFDTVKEVREYLLKYYDEYADNFYADNRHTKILV